MENKEVNYFEALERIENISIWAMHGGRTPTEVKQALDSIHGLARYKFDNLSAEDETRFGIEAPAGER